MVVGLESWFYNFTQLSRKGNSPETLADIPRPYLEYSIWALFKGAEVSSVIGGCIVHPLYRIYLNRSIPTEKVTPNTPKVIRAKCRTLQGRFLLAGMISGPLLAMSYIAAEKISHSEMQKKCYAIRCDAEALTTDRCGLVMGFIGWYWKRFQGAVDGINLGVAYAMFNNKVLAKYTSPLLKDKVEEEERYISVEEAEKNKSKLVKFLSGLDDNKH